MNLRKVLLNIVIQFYKSTLKKRSAFFFVYILTGLMAGNVYSGVREFEYNVADVRAAGDINLVVWGFDTSRIVIKANNLNSQKERVKNLKGINRVYMRIDEISLKQFNVKTSIYRKDFLREFNKFDFRKKNLLNDVINFDTVKNKKDTVVKFEMKKNPWRAVLYSALLPGLGQFYNESYWKVPVVVGLGGYLGYIIVKNHGYFLDYRDLYSASQTSQNPNGDSRLKEFREFYRNQRDQFLLYFLFFYVITAVDAYVDANLYDFDVTDYMRLSVLGRKGILNLDVGF